MDEAQEGRTRRFDELFRAQSPDIVSYCGRWSDSQDAVAEVFAAWRRFDELPEGNQARVWLHATARRVIANQRRSSRRRLALRERLAPPPARGLIDRTASSTPDDRYRGAEGRTGRGTAAGSGGGPEVRPRVLTDTGMDVSPRSDRSPRCDS